MYQLNLLSQMNLGDLPTDLNFTDAGILAVWKTDGSARDDTHVYDMTNDNSFISFRGKQDSGGTAFCKVAVEGHDFFADWDEITSLVGTLPASRPSYTAVVDTYSIDLLRNVDYIRIVVYSGDAPTVCAVKELDVYFSFFLPPDIILTQVK